MEEKNIKVVIIDDMPSITELFGNYFSLAGFASEVVDFNDPQKALEYVKDFSNNIDVIITDFRMPEVDGLDILRVAPPRSLKIMVSGYLSDEIIDELNGMGAHSFEKPASMNSVISLIEDKFQL